MVSLGGANILMNWGMWNILEVVIGEKDKLG